jgi:hypothetical protein
MAAFARVEAAKRRLVFQLDELGLPTDGVATTASVPYYLSALVLEKLRFVHDAVRSRRNPIPAQASLQV